MRRPGKHHGIWSALIFNASLLALPFLGVGVWRAALAGDIYGFHLSPAGKAATRAALNAALARQTPEGADRRVAWSQLVERELAQGDPAAARGFLLAAPAALSPADAAVLENKLPPDATDDQIEAAALSFLEPEAAFDYQPGGGPRGAAVAAVGDLRELAARAQQWTSGQPADEFTLMLSGLALSPRPGGGQGFVEGASVLALARRTGRLQPGFMRKMEELVFAAAPPEKIKREAAAALAASPGAENAAIAGAFAAGMDARGYAKLAQRLRAITAIAHASSAATAARLLEHARRPEDVQRLLLVAAAGGDRAVALGKRGGAEVLAAARATFAPTAQAAALLTGAALALASCAWSIVSALAHALATPWRRPRGAAAYADADL